jgi:hypothetical protein
MADLRGEQADDETTHSNQPCVPRRIDNAVFGDSLLGGSDEPAYSGVLSFMRRRLTRELAGVDVGAANVRMRITRRPAGEDDSS